MPILALIPYIYFLVTCFISATGSQLEAVSTLAAHIRLTSVEVLHRSVPHMATELVSPKTFMECLKMTQSVAIGMKEEEKVGPTV